MSGKESPLPRHPARFGPVPEGLFLPVVLAWPFIAKANRKDGRQRPASVSPGAGPHYLVYLTNYLILRTPAFLAGALFGVAVCLPALRVAGANPLGRRLTSVGSSR